MFCIPHSIDIKIAELWWETFSLLSWPLLQGTRAAWRWWATARAPPAYTTSWPPMLSLTVSQQKYLIIKQKIFKTDLCLLTWMVTSSSSAVTLYCYWLSLYCFCYWLLRRSAVFTISNDIQLIYREGFWKYVSMFLIFYFQTTNEQWFIYTISSHSLNSSSSKFQLC